MQANKNVRPALPCRTDRKKIKSKVIIPRETDCRPVYLWGFIGSVEDFKQFLKAQFILLELGVIRP